jgi:hypothetical protein
MTNRESRRFGLLVLAVALLSLLLWKEARPAQAATLTPPRGNHAASNQPAPFVPDCPRIAAAFAFAFICFTLVGAYDARPQEALASDPSDDRSPAA